MTKKHKRKEHHNEMEQPWGWHYLASCAAGNENTRDKESIIDFVDLLVKEIDMVPYGPTWIERFATHDPNKAGISFCQMIETSNITGHFVDQSGDFYLDVFSCKPFDRETVNLLITKWFQPLAFSEQVLERAAPRVGC